MKAAPAVIGLAALAVAGWAVWRATGIADPSAGEWLEIVEAPLEVWSQYEGELAARRVVSIASQFNGGATIVDLIAEGARIRRGDSLVKFDSFQVESDLARLDREYAAAEADLRSMEYATLPLELREMETALLDARLAVGAETQYLDEIRALAAEDLVSEPEVETQRLKVAGLESKVAQAELRLSLLQEHVHPSRMGEARAKLLAAERQRDMMRDQLAQCVVTSPCDGEVVYVPLPFGTELRPARVGDTVYKNQEFINIPDPSDWIVRCDIPEQDLARVAPGHSALLSPKAWPDITLTGAVETVSAMARPRGAGGTVRYFPATLRVEDEAPWLRSGLSVRVSVLSHRMEGGTLMPRSAVRWADGRPYALVRGERGDERRELVLGAADETRFEVRSGLRPGDRVRP